MKLIGFLPINDAVQMVAYDDLFLNPSKSQTYTELDALRARCAEAAQATGVGEITGTAISTQRQCWAIHYIHEWRRLELSRNNYAYRVEPEAISERVEGRNVRTFVPTVVVSGDFLLPTWECVREQAPVIRKIENVPRYLNGLLLDLESRFSGQARKNPFPKEVELLIHLATGGVATDKFNTTPVSLPVARQYQRVLKALFENAMQDVTDANGHTESLNWLMGMAVEMTRLGLAIDSPLQAPDGEQVRGHLLQRIGDWRGQGPRNTIPWVGGFYELAHLYPMAP